MVSALARVPRRSPSHHRHQRGGHELFRGTLLVTDERDASLLRHRHRRPRLVLRNGTRQLATARGRDCRDAETGDRSPVPGRGRTRLVGRERTGVLHDAGHDIVAASMPERSRARAAFPAPRLLATRPPREALRKVGAHRWRSHAPRGVSRGLDEARGLRDARSRHGRGERKVLEIGDHRYGERLSTSRRTFRATDASCFVARIPGTRRSCGRRRGSSRRSDSSRVLRADGGHGVR